VIKHLRIDPSTLTPRGHNQHRHTWSQAECASMQGGRVGSSLGRRAKTGVVVFIKRIDLRTSRQAAVRPPRGRGGRQHVIEKAVVFIIGYEENATALDLGVAGQNLQHAFAVGPAGLRAGHLGVFGVGKEQ
jgi:hypothetical protein